MPTATSHEENHFTKAEPHAGPQGPDGSFADLVREHQQLVRGIAEKLRKRLQLPFEREELVQHGLVGLWEAARRFDPTRGVRFSTFAYYRIQGAILDAVRASTWYSRGDQARFRGEQLAASVLEQQPTGPSAGPQAALTAISDLLGRVATVHITSLAAASDLASSSDDPESAAALEQLRAKVRAALGKLPIAERDLIRACYFDDQPLAHAGRALGIPKTTAHRMHDRAVAHLRDALDATRENPHKPARERHHCVSHVIM